MTLYLEKYQRVHQKLLDPINEFSKVLVHKSNIQKSVVFLNTNNEPSEKGHKRTMPFKIASKKYLGINLTNIFILMFIRH